MDTRKAFTEEQMKMKRQLDTRHLQTMHLEDIVSELMRRGFKMFYGYGINLRARIVLLPAPFERREYGQEKQGQEVRAGSANESGSGGRNVELPTDRQSVPPVHEEGDDASEGGESSGHDLSPSTEESLTGVQGRIDTVSRVLPSERASSLRRYGVPAEGKFEFTRKEQT